MKVKITNFSNIELNRILGENEVDDGANLEGCLAKMSRE